MTDPIKELRTEVRALGKRMLRSYSPEALAPLLEALERDMRALHMVPPARRARMVSRMQKQIQALPEVQRLEVVGATQEGFLELVFALVRFAVKVL